MSLDPSPKTQEPNRPSAPVCAAYALVLSAFGPYVVPSLGLTTAQIALYPLSVWALWALTRQRLWARAAHLLPVPALLLFMLLWVLLGTAIVSPDASTLSLVAQLDAYTQPLSVSLVALAVATLSPRHDLPRVLRICTLLIVYVLGANSCLMLWSAVTGVHPEGLLSPWDPAHSVSAGASSGEKLLRMARAGRHVGILVEPAIAGLTYTLGLILSVHWLRGARHPLAPLVATLSLVVGGSLPLSKSFYVGVVIAAYYLFSGRPTSRSVGLAAAAIIVTALMAGPLGLGDWALHSRIQDLLSPEGGGISASISGNRYAEGNTTVSNLWPKIAASPWVGYGLAATRLGPLDSEPLAHLASGGFPALAAYLGLIVFTLLSGSRATLRGAEYGRLTATIGLYLLLGGLGRPVLNANAVGVLAVFVLTIVIALSHATPSSLPAAKEPPQLQAPPSAQPGTCAPPGRDSLQTTHRPPAATVPWPRTGRGGHVDHRR